jgi:hypothetical protein
VIPRVARLGTGFVGAGQYYLNDKRDAANDDGRPSAEDYFLHDKRGAQTSHRVGFTETRNLPTQDAATGLKCMAWLAANTQSVRQAAVAAEARAAGMSYDAYVRAKNPFRGRKQQKPVYSMSLAWHPTKNKMPTDAQMRSAIDEVIKVLGLQDHQAVIIQHKDTKHPHVHLIVNRVHPETGKFAVLGNDYLKVSRWALEYEKRTGLIVCPVRVENWQKRDGARVQKAEARKADPKAKGEWVLAKDVPRGDHDWFKSVAHLSPDQIRQARAARHEREREQFKLVGIRREATVEGEITRKYGVALSNTKIEIERLLRAEGWRKARDRDPLRLILEPRYAAQALIDVFTARAFVRPRKIKSLDKVAADLEKAIRDRRHTERAHQTAMHGKMVVRHAAERRRDDERIEALARGARGKSSSERGRKVFNWRGGVETARHVPTREPVIRLADIHAKVVDSAKSAQARGKNALSAIARVLGGAVTTEQLRKHTVGGWLAGTGKRDGPRVANDGRPVDRKDVDRRGVGDLGRAGDDETRGLAPAAVADRPLPVEPVNRTTIVEPDARKGKRTAEPRGEPRVDAGDRAAFEIRRDAALSRIEAEQVQQKRRRRQRPRGKVRRFD